MLLFDFDGVLVDSLDEVAVSAWNAVTGNLATSLEELPQACLQLFRRNRYHFLPAGDALPLMEWCVEEGSSVEGGGHTILSAEAYQHVLSKVQSPVKERTARFFATRKQFIEKDKRKWLELNAPYQPLVDELKVLGAERVIILTNKNREAVLELTHHFGLHIIPANVYSGDGGVTKIDNLLKIHERFKKSEYQFVDDSIGNLQELEEHFNKPTYRDEPSISLQLWLGGWGYLGPDDVRAANASGFEVVSQNTLISRLENILPEGKVCRAIE